MSDISFQVTNVIKLGVIPSADSDATVVTKHKGLFGFRRWLLERVSKKMQSLPPVMEQYKIHREPLLFVLDCKVNDKKALIIMSTYVGERLPKERYFQTYFIEKFKNAPPDIFEQNLSHYANYYASSYRKLTGVQTFNMRPIECDIHGLKYFIVAFITDTSVKIKDLRKLRETDSSAILGQDKLIYFKDINTKLDKSLFISNNTAPISLDAVLEELNVESSSELKTYKKFSEVDLLSYKASIMESLLENGYEITIERYSDPEIKTFIDQYKDLDKQNIHEELIKIEKEIVRIFPV